MRAKCFVSGNAKRQLRTTTTMAFWLVALSLQVCSAILKYHKNVTPSRRMGVSGHIEWIRDVPDFVFQKYIF